LQLLILKFYIFTISIETTKIDNTKKKELLRKKWDNILKKIENYEVSLNIPKTHRWDPMDSKYSAYLEFYCINQLSKFIDKLRKERNEYLFNSSYLYNEFHKGNINFFMELRNFHKD
jgi:hypothetical protein